MSIPALQDSFAGTGKWVFRPLMSSHWINWSDFRHVGGKCETILWKIQDLTFTVLARWLSPVPGSPPTNSVLIHPCLPVVMEEVVCRGFRPFLPSETVAELSIGIPTVDNFLKTHLLVLLSRKSFLPTSFCSLGSVSLVVYKMTSVQFLTLNWTS